MGIFDKLFRRRKKGNYCVICGEEILEPENEPLFGAAYMTFPEVASRIGLQLQTPAYVCEDCGAVVCQKHICWSGNPHPWKKFPNCPKCGSENMETR